MAALRVLHLVGSAESDFLCDLSRLYDADCLRTLEDPERYHHVIAYVTPEGQWRFPEGLAPEQIEAAAPHPLGDAVRLLAALEIDVAVPQMFCRPGMTTYRSLLDLLGIPFVGNTATAMDLTADKQRAKDLVAAAGVAVPGGRVLAAGDETPAVVLPVVVKPLDSDNSFGVTLVRRGEDLAGAIASAREHGERVLVEDYVELGREVRCGVLEVDGELVPLPLEEYGVDSVNPIRRTEDKIASAERGLSLVAKTEPYARILPADDPATETVWEVARRCHRALGCRHYSLFDLRLDPEGRPWFLEAGLYCSFARQSVVATMAAAAGIDIKQLFAGAVREALPGRREEIRR